ncbi:MAG: GDP-L-fucose synthase [Syntrophorhabdus aromaticivorans]|uniref:GDP-L-fucose synthase n=1 Tax=Syntrophorhabdus aromaticivorans TaxID=328301 RepID=A0A971M554_9BACT|nr:GDP-L-fucose synthase [Syntrophorhabdus aromaticivorans]
MERDSKIFVAGGSGMVGSGIVRALLAAGYTNITASYNKRSPIPARVPGLSFPASGVNLVRLDLSRQSETEAFFEEEHPEYVFLAAAKVGGILANSTYTAEFIYDNITIASNVIHSSYRSGTKKLLNLGSSCIYPRLCPQPMKEEYLLAGGLEPTNEPYAIAKIAAIKLCRYYNEQYGTDFISVMPTNLYGPNDNFDFEISHVLPALIRKFHLARLLSEGAFDLIRKDFVTWGNCRITVGESAIVLNEESPDEDVVAVLRHFGISQRSSASNLPPSASAGPVAVELWGTGEPYREFLHVDDLAAAGVFLMEHYNYRDIGEFVNIGAGEEQKIRDLALLVRDVVGFDGDIVHDTTKPDGMPRKLLDISKIKALGWSPRIDLRQGIVETYEWYRSAGVAL